MVFDLKEWLRRIPINLRILTVAMEARRDTPKEWFAGGYSRIKLLRLSLAVVALLNYSALALGTNFTLASWFNLWVGLAGAGYILIAFVYLLGLRMWYAPTTVFVILSAIVNFAINLNGGPLGVGGATYDFFVVAAIMWLYVLFFGIIALKYDKGSRINDLLQQS
jgi:hypothetical protein